jgi:transcriptional regulator with GAF, ATPase, and Fis domain
MSAIELDLIGDSPEFLQVVRTAHLVARTDVTLLISGESGTGKELVARRVHRESRRADGPLVTVNCAALPDGLVESELFGHRKGAFTGAACDQRGRFQAAQGGTLFLDEIGELPLSAQAKLLRFLESGECQVVGSAMPQKVDVRVIAATNRDLAALVREGRFREDLYYRLNVVPLELPPLRARSGDVVRLLDHLTRKLAAEHDLIPPRYSRPAMEVLSRHPWPGNVRELRNFCERMVILLPDTTLQPENLPREMLTPRVERDGEAPSFTLPESGIRLDELEVHMIRQALDKTRGNRSRAARLLGLTRDTLLYRLKKYAIEA